MKAMGLDVGTRTIGVAVSDPLGLTAQGIEVIRRRDLAQDISRLGELADKHKIECFVVGLPLNMDGTYGPAAEEIRRFADVIRKKFNKPVYEEDERLTTVAAERVLLEADLSRQRRRQVIDKVAATLILQNFLASKKKEIDRDYLPGYNESNLKG